jgi:hypothetical protein
MRTLLTIGILLAAQIAGQGQESVKQALPFAKRIDVQTLDSRLPHQHFSKWFNEVVGPGAKIGWEVNDCGEQTGNASEKDRDLPFCAQGQADLPDGRTVVISIGVGTMSKGLTPRSVAIRDILIVQDGKARTVSQLSDLVNELRSKH